MGLGAATPAHGGAMLWLVTWHCHLPLLAAQMTASGTDDAGALREAKAAADTSACTDSYYGDGRGRYGCPLDTWTADTEPCGDGHDSLGRGWLWQATRVRCRLRRHWPGHDWACSQLWQTPRRACS